MYSRTGLSVYRRGATIARAWRPSETATKLARTSTCFHLRSSSSSSSLDAAFSRHESFVQRHIGPNEQEQKAMLSFLELEDLEELTKKAVPGSILLDRDLDLPEPKGEYELLMELKEIGSKNEMYRTYLGMGYHGTRTPTTIIRNIFENPGWTTQYTPYQAELAQGRLESLLNYQTMIADMMGLDVSNASLLDEATAAAEAMTLCQRWSNLMEKKKVKTEQEKR